jgi:hypothetical protein
VVPAKPDVRPEDPGGFVRDPGPEPPRVQCRRPKLHRRRIGSWNPDAELSTEVELLSNYRSSSAKEARIADETAVVGSRVPVIPAIEPQPKLELLKRCVGASDDASGPVVR